MELPLHPDDEPLLEARRFRVVRRRERLADGSQRSREVVLHPGSVVVVPFVDDDTICLVNVARTAVDRTLLELPAGTLDREESLAAGLVEPAGSFWMSPGILRERMHLFVARELVPGPQALEPGEQITTRLVAWDDAVAMCRAGIIDDAKTVAGILLVDARRKA